MITRNTLFLALASFGIATCLVDMTAQAAQPAVPAPPATAHAGPAVHRDACDGAPRCYDAGTFVAEVVQVSASAMGPGVRHQAVAINVRFRNVSDKPVILAYRSGSSAALDNFGNGFTWGRPGTHDTSVKGIGMVAGRSVDTQFALTPGQARNATFNIIRFNAAPPIGNAWNYDVVIDEIEILPGQVVRSARQNSISFSSLTAGAFAAAGGDFAIGADGQPADATQLANKVIDLFNRAKSGKKN
ncbi:MAG: hypothetical protein WDO56_11190 [Gammaproteobacteria bacterium]